MRRACFTAVLTIAVALSACGGGGSSDQTTTFKAAYQPVVAQFKQISHDIGVAIQGAGSKTDAELGTEFLSLAGRWQAEATKLDALKPPSDLASTFGALTSAVGRVSTDLAGIASAAQTHSKSAAGNAAAAGVTDIVAARTAATAIDKKLGIK
jgi:hypothetical protein